jgi:hypothetical protein
MINNIQTKTNSKVKKLRRSSVIDRLKLKLTNPEEIFEENIKSDKATDKNIRFIKKYC